MLVGIPSYDELSEFDEVVLRAVYNEVKGRSDTSVPEYQVYADIGKVPDPETSVKIVIKKSILNLIEKGLLVDDITAPLGKKNLNEMNICLTLEGKKYIEEQCINQ